MVQFYYKKLEVIMRKYRKLILSGILALGLFGCSSGSSDQESINIIAPAGAPTLALVSTYQDVTTDGTFDIVDGPDLLQAEFIKDDSIYDIIVAPINLGCALIATDQTDYKMAAVITWGNLFYVGTSPDVLNEEGELALFGEAAVPGKIVEQADIETSLTPVYYASATNVQQQLLAGHAKAGLLAEPLVTATIAAGAQAGLELQVIGDLQESYPGGAGYPQAAIFVKESSSLDGLLSEVETFANNGYPELATYLDEITTDTLKLPAAALVESSIEGQNIKYVPAADCVDEVTDFLTLFNIEYSADMAI